MVASEQKARLLANLLVWEANIIKYGPEGDKPMRARVFGGSSLPGRVSPEEVIVYLPEGWKYKRFRLDDYPAEIRESLGDEVTLLEDICFYPPDTGAWNT